MAGKGRPRVVRECPVCHEPFSSRAFQVHLYTHYKNGVVSEASEKIETPETLTARTRNPGKKSARRQAKKIAPQSLVSVPPEESGEVHYDSPDWEV